MITDMKAFVKHVEDAFPGAEASTGYYDLMYCIRFSNGTVLENTERSALIREAWAFYHSTYKLTGEYP